MQKNMYYRFVISLSAINDIFLSTNSNNTYILIHLTFLVKIDISVTNCKTIAWLPLHGASFPHILLIAAIN